MAGAESDPAKFLVLELETDHPDLIETKVFNVFLTYLPRNSQQSACVAAARIHQLLLENKDPNGDNKPEQGIGGFLHLFWDMYFLLGCQISQESEEMNRHVRMVGALKALPSEVHTERYGRVWQDLPQMAMFLTERWNQISLRDDNQNRQSAGQAWYNMNGLLVKLTASGLVNANLNALQSFVSSLECRDSRDAEFLFQYLVPAAALWLHTRTTAAQLFEACHQGECRDSNSGGTLWKMDLHDEQDPRRGFSLQRWEFWRQRLEYLSRHRHATERSKEICRTALQVMEEVATAKGGHI